MGVIVLKHLAREFDLDPFRLRQILRKEYGYAAGRRWRWDEKADAGELKLVREFLTGRAAGRQASELPTNTNPKSSGGTTSPSRKKSTEDASSMDHSKAKSGTPTTPSRSGARKSSSAYVEQLRETIATGDDFIRKQSERLGKLRAAKETVVLGDDTTARQKLSKVKRAMKAIDKSGDSPKPKK